LEAAVLTVVILTFLAVFALLTAVSLAFTAVRESPRTELKRRLRLMEKAKNLRPLPDDLRREILGETPPFERFLSHLPVIRNTEKWLDQAGTKITVQSFYLLLAAATLAGFVLTVILRRDYLLASLVALVIFILPFPVLLSMKQRRYERFTEQLPDVLTMIARSIRAGHALSSSLELVGNESADPAGGLFKTAFEQQKLGLPVADTLMNMTERIDSLDLRFFVMVITINSEVGGNLAETLDKLAETIRERLKIRRQVKVYTAQGRLSGYLLAILPIVSFLLINFLIPGYEDVLTKEKPGQYILALAALMQLTGFLFIRKIVKIRI
jgi:tight adherence protein B